MDLIHTNMFGLKTKNNLFCWSVTALIAYINCHFKVNAYSVQTQNYLNSYCFGPQEKLTLLTI